MLTRGRTWVDWSKSPNASGCAILPAYSLSLSFFFPCVALSYFCVALKLKKRGKKVLKSQLMFNLCFTNYKLSLLYQRRALYGGLYRFIFINEWESHDCVALQWGIFSVILKSKKFFVFFNEWLCQQMMMLSIYDWYITTSEKNV